MMTNEWDDYRSAKKNMEREKLRDYFAAAALQAIITKCSSGDLKTDAGYAYVAADAMLEAREQE